MSYLYSIKDTLKKDYAKTEFRGNSFTWFVKNSSYFHRKCLMGNGNVSWETERRKNLIKNYLSSTLIRNRSRDQNIFDLPAFCVYSYGSKSIKRIKCRKINGLITIFFYKYLATKRPTLGQDTKTRPFSLYLKHSLAHF